MEDAEDLTAPCPRSQSRGLPSDRSKGNLHMAPTPPLLPFLIKEQAEEFTSHLLKPPLLPS